MRILVHEYLSTGALSGRPGADSLAREGLAMLTAVLADLSACPGVEAVTLVAPDLVPAVEENVPAAIVHLVERDNEEAAFRHLARGCEATLVIAPEFDDVLARRAEWALEEGSRLLGPTPLGIRLTADKLWLARHWKAHGVPTPATVSYAPGSCPFPFPVVVKPRAGAGAQATFYVRTQDTYEAVPALARRQGCSAELIVQPCHGLDGPASVSFLIGPAGRLALLPGRQVIRYPNHQLRYDGGTLPLREGLRQSAIDLADQALAVVPGLQGYVGVDLHIDRHRRRARELAFEINPRLTTSYVGLRRLARFNIMQVMLDVLEGRPPGPLDFDLDSLLRFSPDGSFS